jgi:preprotein translocase subunit SecY
LEVLWRLVGWKRLVVTGLCLVAWRALEQITIPGTNQALLSTRLQTVDTSSLIHAIGTGIVLTTYSIVALGIGPYINALIIMWVLQAISSRLRSIGSTDDGRLRLLRWTRALTIPLAMGQAYGWTVLMQSNSVFPSSMDWFPRLVICLELTAGTMILVWIADLIDERGLGFGNGAFLIYALTPLAIDVHKLANAFAAAPSVEAFYLPFAIWVVFSIAIVALTVAVRSAVRRVLPATQKKATPSNPVELQILMSGVLRPPMFTQALLFLPVVIANFNSQTHPGFIRWIFDYLTPYGSNPWADLANVLLDSCLVIAFTYFVVAVDFRLRSAIPAALFAHVNRLTFIGGCFLALIGVVLPVLEWNASHAAGRDFGLSGYEAVFLVLIVLAIMGSAERAAKIRTMLPAPMSYLP